MTTRDAPTKGGRSVGPHDCVVDPGLGQVCYEELLLSGLTSRLRLTGNSNYATDSFTVATDFLDRRYSYKIRVKREARSNSNIGFNSNCSYAQVTVSVPRGSSDYFDYDYDFDIYGCSADGGTVIAQLLKNGSVMSGLSREQDVDVVDDRPTPTPTPSPTYTPSRTHTPTRTPASTSEPPEPPTDLDLS